MTWRALALTLAGVLAGCAGVAPRPSPPPPVDTAAARDLPAARGFTASAQPAPDRSNAEIARDFLDLTLRLENDVELPVFTRFETPITIALTGRFTPVFDTELDALVGRIRAEAGIDLRRVADPAAAAITVEAIRRADLARTVPQAACFVVPRRITWAAFSGRRDPGALRWSDLERRDTATIFVPADVSAQEIRDCLHEEVAQALGPVNDLYRLEDSIFNDDNMHSVLTGFDMVILRAVYDPALASGMTRAEVAGRLPAILARVNPGGARPVARPPAPTNPAWKRAIEGALSPGRPDILRRRDSLRAVEIARDAGWNDARLGLSLLTAARLSAPGGGRATFETFLEAAEVYGARDVTAIHAAHVGIQIAAFALAAGDPDAAIRIADSHIPAARAARNAALLGDFLLVKAAAVEAKGDAARAVDLRRDGFAYARYGLRSEADVLRRAADIAALVPSPQEGT